MSLKDIHDVHRNSPEHHALVSLLVEKEEKVRLRFWLRLVLGH